MSVYDEIKRDQMKPSEGTRNIGVDTGEYTRKIMKEFNKKLDATNQLVEEMREQLTLSGALNTKGCEYCREIRDDANEMYRDYKYMPLKDETGSILGTEAKDSKQYLRESKVYGKWILVTELSDWKNTKIETEVRYCQNCGRPLL